MVTKTQIIKYAVLPGIIPRLYDLVRSGFAHIAYLMAVIYNTVRLLPSNHPYLDPRNMGRFGIRHVMTEASRNLVFKKQNIDQIIIYFTILAGLILLLGQFILLGTSLLANNPVNAAPSPQTQLITLEMFNNPSNLGAQGPENDLALIVLDRVFGVPNIFNSCISTGVACTRYTRLLDSNTGVPGTEDMTPEPFPNNYHAALHALLQFYSYGVFFVGVMVIIYYIITIVAETAQSGTPFGQRFNRAWAPVRLIMFFALIIPFNGSIGGDTNFQGFNFGQLATLKTAQLGSNMATNAWAYFNGGATDLAGGPLGATAGSTLMSQQKSMIATPEFKQSAVSEMIQFLHIAKTCTTAYAMLAETEEKTIYPYLVRSSTIIGTEGENRMDFIATDFDEAREFFLNGKMTIRFGLIRPEDGTSDISDKVFNQALGNVIPMCGDLNLPVNATGEPGALEITEGIYNLIKQIWADAQIAQSAECLVEQYGVLANSTVVLSCENLLDKNSVNDWMITYGGEYQNIINEGIEAQKDTANLIVSTEMMELGWVGASIFYNKVAQMNGAVTSAAMSLPFKGQLPYLMELTLARNTVQNANVSTTEQFNTRLTDPTGQGVFLNLKDPREYRILRVLRATYLFWDKLDYAETSHLEKSTGNAVIDFINMVLGSSGLFEMRKNIDVHPLAQLSSLGKGLMDAAIRNAAISVGGALGSNMLKTIEGFSAESAKAISGSFSSLVVATIGIAAILFYVLPMLPFIYFLFAASGWIKSIFEAIVAIPLWALAHLRIDGEGLPGPGATNGYFLLLEIFLRPILIFTGFVASISIFSASVSTLNIIFDLVVANVGGFDYEEESLIQQGAGTMPSAASMMYVARSSIDEFFFTGMYAIICYMMALACFKLIDQIPNKILRWAGVSVSTFQENAGDPASQLTNQVYKGSLLVGNQIKRTSDSNLAIITS